MADNQCDYEVADRVQRREKVFTFVSSFHAGTTNVCQALHVGYQGVHQCSMNSSDAVATILEL